MMFLQASTPADSCQWKQAVFQQAQLDFVTAEQHFGARTMEYLSFLGVDVSHLTSEMLLAQLSGASQEGQIAAIEAAVGRAVR